MQCHTEADAGEENANGKGSAAILRTGGFQNMGALPTVPEPATLTLLLVGVGLMLRRRR